MGNWRIISGYQITDDSFIRHWKNGKKEGEVRIELEKLSADTSLMTCYPNKTLSRTRAGVALLVLALAIFFSAIQNTIPLLSVFLGVYGLWFLIRALRKFRLETWTVIHKKSGERFANLMHRGCNDKDREKFVAALSEIVNKK